MINKDDLINLLEPHFKKDLLQDNYEVKTITATKLLTHNRFDIAFKLLYLELREKNLALAKEIYKDHIRALTLNKFTEPGNRNKNSLVKFIADFENTFHDIKINGFDNNKSILPLSKDNSIANGAHRISSSIFLDKRVSVVNINSDNHNYNYKFFYNRNVPELFLDFAAEKFIEYSNNIYLAFVWPTAKGFDKEIEKLIPSIVYRKEISLNITGAHNLLSQIYYGEKWLGNFNNNFKGAYGKLMECFKNFDPVRVIAFQANNLKQVSVIKDEIRNLFNIGKHSIHITDSKEEALRISKLVFNNNSIHFLNNSNPNKYISIHSKIKQFKNFLNKNEINFDDAVLDSGIVLSIYGLRECKDIDFIVSKTLKSKYQQNGIENHDQELVFHKKNKEEIIFNPKYYFSYQNLKFISFSQLYKMKLIRAEEKDINDVKMMKALVSNNVFKKIFYQKKQNFYYFKIKIKQKIIITLKFIGIFEFIKKLIK